MKGFVDTDGSERIQQRALLSKDLLENGNYTEASINFFITQFAVAIEVDSIDFYNVLNQQRYFDWSDFEQSQEKFIKMLQSGKQDIEGTLREVELMALVHEALGLPEEAEWDSSGVFEALFEDFMNPVVDIVEKVLNETSVHVIVYSGQLDLICATPGTMAWVNNLNWHGREEFAVANRPSVHTQGFIEGYNRRYENLDVYWVRNASINKL